MTVLSNICDRFTPVFSLENADPAWTNILANSRVCAAWTSAKRYITASLPDTTQFGTLLQRLGFAVMVLLFLIIAAPQFASDKEWLALLTICGFALRLLGSWLNGAEKYRPNAIDGLVLAYFAVNLVASCASHYFKDSLFGLAKLSVYIMAYFLFVGSLQHDTRRRIVVVLSALTIGGLLVSLYGLYQYKIGVAPLATWEDPSIEEKTTRIYATLGNPNLLAGYLVPICPVAFSLAMIAGAGKKISKWLSLPLFAATAIITAATFLTGSRGAYLALLGALIILIAIGCSWLWQARPSWRLPLALATIVVPVIGLVGIHFALPSFEHRFLSIFAGSEHSSNAYRLNVWRSSLQMFKDNWVIGIGTGNKTFRLAYGLYMRSGFDALGTYCVPLEVAVETGLPGLVIFVSLVLATLTRAHRRFWGSCDSVQRWLAVAGMAAIMGMMIHGLFDTVFYRPQVQFIFWLAIAWLVALPMTAEGSKPINNEYTE